MTNAIKNIFRKIYYSIYGGSGKEILINNQPYTVSAHVARGINSTIDELPLKLLCNMVKDASLVIDVGANIGVVSVIISKEMKPASHIYAFEPAPLSYKFLSDTARVQKGNAKITPQNFAVSNSNGKLFFTNDSNSCTNHISNDENENTVAVEAITIDDFCTEKGLRPEVIKIDVEGAEFWALQGMKSTLKNCDCKVLVEIHKEFLLNNGVTGAEFGKLIDEIGYQVFDVKGQNIPGRAIIDNVCVILSKSTPNKKIFSI